MSVLNAINGFAETDEYDFYTEVGDDGFFDLVPVCNHEVVSNLIRSRLLVEVDWDGVVRSELVADGLKLQIVRSVIAATFGVASVDMSGFEFSIGEDGEVSLGKVCPVIDCANSRECFVL